MIPTSFENEQELQRVLAENPQLLPSLLRIAKRLAEHSSLDLRCVAVAKCQHPNGATYYAPSSTVDAGGSVPVDRPPSPKAIRLVGSAASYRKSAVPPWRGSAQYQFVKRAGVWIETYREDPFAARTLIAARVTETPPDPGRVQWDG
jgi:hypothetical protein